LWRDQAERAMAQRPSTPMASRCLDITPPLAAECTTRLRAKRFAADALHGDALRREHLVLQGVHARRRLIDMAHERQRALQDGFESLAILDARLGILVLDHQKRVRHVARET